MTVVAKRPPARRRCTRCGLNRRADAYVSPRGRVCARCQATTRKATGQANKRTARYGLSRADHAGLVALQGGLCAICRKPRRYALNVDHDHATGAVRGLLCRADNKLLAVVRDDPDRLLRAVEYLRQPPMVLLAATRTDLGGDAA